MEDGSEIGCPGPEVVAALDEDQLNGSTGGSQCVDELDALRAGHLRIDGAVVDLDRRCLGVDVGDRAGRSRASRVGLQRHADHRRLPRAGVVGSLHAARGMLRADRQQVHRSVPVDDTGDGARLIDELADRALQLRPATGQSGQRRQVPTGRLSPRHHPARIHTEALGVAAHPSNACLHIVELGGKASFTTQSVIKACHDEAGLRQQIERGR